MPGELYKTTLSIKEAKELSEASPHERHNLRLKMFGGWLKGTSKTSGISSDNRIYIASVDGVTSSKLHFSGKPESAARQFVAISKLDIGLDNAIKFQLIEVTPDVKRANGKPYKYNYYGWRTDRTNLAIPCRKFETAKEAYEYSRQIGAKIKQSKDIKKMVH
jgi:hypothetical protein